jgi:serralysin
MISRGDLKIPTSTALRGATGAEVEIMARVQMTAAYSNLNDWSGRLFEATDDTVVNTQTATSYRFTYGALSSFENFSVTISGTGFVYDGDGRPTGGKITKIEVRDAGGALVLTIDQIGGAVPSDLAQIVSDMFGWEQAGDGASANGKIAWSHLLLGNDTIIGTAGDDRQLQGFMDGNDLFTMKGGDDWIVCGSGRDTVNGGAGFDFVSFDATAFNEGASAFRGISANLSLGTVIDCWGFTDKLVSIEGVWGSRFNDKIIGNGLENEFAGLRGRDTINGGADTDRVYYDDDRWNGGRNGVTVDLETGFKNGVITGFAIDGFGQRDTLINIEEVKGTDFDDNITGSRRVNQIEGGDGNDTMAGAGGADTFRFRETGHLGDNDVINGFVATGANHDRLAFEMQNFNGMIETVTLVNGTDANAAVGTFVFDGTTSTLYWDEDGTGATAKMKVAVLTGVTVLTDAVFEIWT